MKGKGYKVVKIKPSNPDDERGPIYHLTDKRKGKQVTAIKRKKGSIFGGHYHLGNDPSKNPERLFLVDGKIRVLFTTVDGECLGTEILEEGDLIEIYPKVVHYMTALEDIIIIESRETIFDPENSDTVAVPSDL